MAPRSPIQCFDSLKPYSTRAITPECFWVVKSIARFFRRSPSGKQPGDSRKALTAAEKYQYHLKSNASWPGSGFGSLRRAHTSLPNSKVAWGEYRAGGEKLQADDNRAN